MKFSYSLKTLSFLTLIFLTLSCSDEESSPQNFRLKEVRYSSGSNSMYEYTNDGKLAKITSDGDYSTSYAYDSKGRLITTNSESPEYQYDRTEYTYRADGTLEESITFTKEIGPGPEHKRKTTYIFSNKKITDTQYYTWDLTNNEWYGTPSVTKYTYDSKGNHTKLIRETDYYVYSYDEAGNRISSKSYELKLGSTTQFYMYRESTYTFDAKKYIYSSYNNPYVGLVTSYQPANNILDAIHKELDESGSTLRTTNSSNTYEYNNAGYPIKQNNNIEFVLENF